MRLRILSAFLLACCLTSAAFAADKPVDVRDLMTASQFHATGLDRLTPQELAAFNAWLATYAPAGASAAAPVPVAAATPNPTAAPAASSVSGFGEETMTGSERGEPKRIESHIVGTFAGWNGHTRFTLANGQVWQQADSSSYDIKLENPQVVIKRLGFGYLLTLTGHGATVFVRRVQ